VTSRRLTATIIGTFALVGPGAAQAGDPALAEQLYELGRQLMAEGRVSEACPRFAESQRLDPATGTLLNLATCHEGEGKLATAWAEFKTAQTASHRDAREDREQYAREHLAALEPRLSYITVTVPEASREPDLEVKLDGNVIGPASWGVAVPVDPGAHDVAAHAAGRVPFAARVTVTTLARHHAVTVTLAPVPVTAPAEPKLPLVAVAPPLGVDSSPPTEPTRIAGIVVGGVSLVALGAGVGFAVRAKQKWDARNADGRCAADDTCSPEGLAYGSQAQTAATLADVSFVIGAIGAVTASYLLWIRRPPDRSTATSQLRLAPSPSASGGGLTLTGAW
jgi:hypothetical protein